MQLSSAACKAYAWLSSVHLLWQLERLCTPSQSVHVLELHPAHSMPEAMTTMVDVPSEQQLSSSKVANGRLMNQGCTAL